MTDESMSGERSEDDKLCQAPITVTMCGREWQIPLLPYRSAKEWRKRYAEFQKRVMASAGRQIDGDTSPEEVASMVQSAMVELPDEMIDLFFLYAAELQDQQDYIEQHATEQELVRAAGEVLRVASPLSYLAMTVKR